MKHFFEQNNRMCIDILFSYKPLHCRWHCWWIFFLFVGITSSDKYSALLYWHELSSIWSLLWIIILTEIFSKYIGFSVPRNRLPYFYLAKLLRTLSLLRAIKYSVLVQNFNSSVCDEFIYHSKTTETRWFLFHHKQKLKTQDDIFVFVKESLLFIYMYNAHYHEGYIIFLILYFSGLHRIICNINKFKPI